MTSARHCWCFGFAFQKRISEDRKNNFNYPTTRILLSISSFFIISASKLANTMLNMDTTKSLSTFFKIQRFFQFLVSWFIVAPSLKNMSAIAFCPFCYISVDWSWNEDFPRATLSSCSDFSVQTLCTQLNWWSKIQVTSAVNYIWRSWFISGALMFQPIWKRFNVT